MNFTTHGILEAAEQAPADNRTWLTIAIMVLILVARHLVISLLSRTEKRR